MHKNKTFYFFEMIFFISKETEYCLYWICILQCNSITDIINNYWKNTQEIHLKTPLEKYDFLKKILLLLYY